MREERNILVGDIKYAEKRIIELNSLIESMKSEALEIQRKIMKMDREIKKLEISLIRTILMIF